ncbi:MAG: hypothetical protein ABSA85_03145 [Terracidiphilus sp.]|jgi:hypothetical protein
MLPNAHQSNPTLMILECGMTALAAASAFAFPRLGNGLFGRVERFFGRLAQRQGLAVACVGLSVIVLRLAIFPLFPVPLPFVPDDFSFLLACDTFAHGRLANPTPAMWTHFESIHITMLPTYQSMYFPGQGLVLAASKVILGNPWIGLLIVSALMCAALCWMLQAWLPSSWALLGGAIAVLRLGVFSYWTNTYHAGGSLGALGGALILGALPRLMKTARMRYATLIGIGITILVLTRPYEGILMCLPAGFVLVRWMWKGKNRPSPAAMARLAATPLLFGMAAVAWMGYYDYRAFGNPLTPPYTVNRNTYAIAPYYVWQHARPEPNYRYAEMRKFYHKGEGDFFEKIHTPGGFLPHTLEKVAFTFLFYTNFTLLIPLIMVRRVFLDKRIRFLVVCVLVLAAGMAIEVFLLPHYVAPFACAFYAIGLQMMRHLRLWKPEGQPVGLALVRATVSLCVLLACLRVFAEPLHIAPSEWPASSWNFTWLGPQHFGVEREEIEARLSQLPRGQLAIVRYWGNHDPFDEWVYNGADIDHAKVIWARDQGSAGNQELIRYYRDRTVWLVEPDAIPARVWPYPLEEPKP